MTPTSPRVIAQSLDELETSAKAQVVSAIEALNRLMAEVDAGKVGPKSEVAKVIGDIRDWLKIAHEMELRLEKSDQGRTGSGRGYALDLEEARSSIGCRLDRLRRSCCSGKISG